MGSSQSRRPRVHSSFPTSPDNTKLQSSPSKQLLNHDCKQYDTTTEEVVTKLEQKIEHLEQLVLSKTAAVEGSIRDNAANENKITDVDQKIECLKRLLFPRTAMEGSSWEIAATEKMETGHEQKIKALERITVKNSERAESIIELQAKVDGLVFMSSHQNSTLELEQLGKDAADKPEFVNGIGRVILMLIFIVSVSIGMQL